MRFARRVFLWSGWYGLFVLLPMLFLEERIARDFPPPTNHPEQYYGFIGVALAWQIVFLMIARDPIRYRPIMIPAMVEKFLPAGSVVALYGVGRIDLVVTAPFVIDLLLGVLFAVSYARTHPESQGTDAPAGRTARLGTDLTQTPT